VPIIYDVPGTYHFVGAVAYDRLGSSWRTAAGLRSVSVIDPTTGLLPTNLVQDGVPVTWLTADANSRYSFTCDIPNPVVDFGAGAEGLSAVEVPRLAIAAGGATDTAIDARMKWAPATAYTLGQQVLSPNSDVVKANVAHTSAAAYVTDVAKWDLSATFAAKVVQTDLAALRGVSYANASNFTTDLQAQVDAMAVSGGGIVKITKGGTVNLTATIDLKEGVSIEGVGKEGTEIFLVGNFPAFASATPLVYRDNIGLANLRITRTHAAPTTPIIDMTGIRFSRLQDLNIRQLTARGSSVGILFGAYSYYNETYGLQVRGCSDGVRLQAAANRNKFFGCGAYTCDNGFVVDASNSNKFFGSAAETCDGIGFLLRNGAILNSLFGCAVEDTPTCFKIDGTGTPAISNYIVGSLALERSGGTRYSGSRVANVIIDPDSVNQLAPATVTSFVDAYLGSAQGSMSAGVWTKIAFATEITDQLNEFASSTFTAAIAGLYSLSAGALFPTAAAGNHLQLAVYVNGVIGKVIADGWTSNTSPLGLKGACQFNLAAGDTVEVYANASVSVGITSGGGNTYFQITRTA